MNNNTIFGISGSKIEIKQNVVIKTSTNITRFEKQIEKQTNFKHQQYFKTPKINSILYQPSSLQCTMEYIDGMDCITYFNLADKTTLLNIVDKIFNFIDSNIDNSKFVFVDKDILLNKIESINFENTLKQEVFKYIYAINDIKLLLPIGECHGDFTFVNMIYQNDKIYLLDFLDCYLESPIQDIVKLRQETNFFWSIFEHKHKTSKNLNYSKIAASYKFLDNIVDEHYKKFDWYNKFYSLFQIINLCRILPYVKIKEINEYIQDCIKKLLKGQK